MTDPDANEPTVEDPVIAPATVEDCKADYQQGAELREALDNRWRQ